MAPIVHLLPLTIPMLESLAAGQPPLAGLAMAEGAIPPFLVEAGLENLRRGLNPLWFAPWLYFAGRPVMGVGSASFKGAPVEGRVELGHVIAPAWRGRGIATVGLALMVEQALRMPQVSEVYAENAADNLASRRVLGKCGFLQLGMRQDEGGQWLECWVRPRADEWPQVAPED